MNHTWSELNFMASGQTLLNCGQKDIIQEYGYLKCTVSKDDFSVPIILPRGDYFGDFWIQPAWVCIGESMYQFSSGLVALENL